jgi:hypothetical protein
MAVGVLVAAGHYFASKLGLYYAVGYADVAMHFLGGLCAGLGAILVFFTSGVVRLPWRDTRVVAVVAIVSTLAAGLAWEVHELLAGLVDPVLDRADTIGDLALDLLGGLFAFGYFRLAVTPEETDVRG